MWKRFVSAIKKLGIKGVLLMNFGFLACALSTVIFLSPSGIISSGATGLSILLQLLFSKIDYYVFLYGINGALLIVSVFALGWDFTVKTIYGSLMLPTYGMLVTFLLNFIKSKFGIDVISAAMEVDASFVILFASGLMGYGIGINMKLGGSTGGFDVLEAIMQKYLHLSLSTSMYILNSVLIISGMWVYQKNVVAVSADPNNLMFRSFLAEGLAATIYIFVQGIVVDIITFGGLNKKAVFIQSDKYEEIRDYIINDLARGLTYVDSEGGFKKDSKKMLITICYSREYFTLRDKIQAIDPNAFLFVTKATEVRGLGFNFETPEHILSRKKIKK